MKQTIPGTVPSKSNCYSIVVIKRKDGAGQFTTIAKKKNLKEYEKAFQWQCNHYRNAGIEGPFKFEMDVYYPNNRSDLDNSCKVVLDCLQGIGTFKNDNQCAEIFLRKFIDKANPRIEFTVTAMFKPEFDLFESKQTQEIL